MSLSSEAGKALGGLFRNLRNPRWIARQAGETALSYYVLNPTGKKVIATIKGAIHHDDEHGNPQKVGDVLHCPDGYEYLMNNGKTYVYDIETDSYIHATA